MQYTLTSADHTQAPASWVLQGSVDGLTWTDLDRRTDETFPWDRQTRAFTLDRPGTYAHYRLVLDGDTGGASSGARAGQVSLAEVELLS